MKKKIISFIFRQLVALRYSVKLVGLDKIEAKGNQKILFLANHPALIDPIILISSIYNKFKPRPLVDAGQMDGSFANYIIKETGAIAIPDMKEVGRSGIKEVIKSLKKVADHLDNNENVLLYPSGRIYRSRLEHLGSNSGVEQILKMVPDVRIVMVRTTGLWGSSFGRASGRAPAVGRDWKKQILSIISNLIFFVPKRKVEIEFLEPDDFPGKSGRLAINSYLENFYNQTSKPNMYVPHFFWEGRKPKQRPEPVTRKNRKDA